jgi:hypothetical protein
MSKVFVIPDVHLKPWMFEKAAEKISEGEYDHIVILGDLVDDWGQERNLALYDETFDAAIKFIVDHPNSLFCYGNHDLSYLWIALESGYSAYAQPLCERRLKEMKAELPDGRAAYIHRIGNVLFSHGGLTESFVNLHFGNKAKYDIDQMISYINTMGKSYMWVDDSPIWARPQYGNMRLYPSDMMQVVGHTPVKAPIREWNLLTLDNFSTYRDGKPIGHETFCWVDTESMEYSIIN